MKQEDDNTVDKFTFSIPHKWGKYVGILLTSLSSFGIMEYNGVIDVLEDSPASKECIQEGTTIGDVNLSIKGVK